MEGGSRMWYPESCIQKLLYMYYDILMENNSEFRSIYPNCNCTACLQLNLSITLCICMEKPMEKCRGEVDPFQIAGHIIHVTKRQLFFCSFPYHDRIQQKATFLP
ncbi:hypothetical protein T4B_11023 [Trichinella pseudospiralis]|uniref:Uncharacterized protein n=1 Tax=Trichinella pseudospiralis TaxID=6337 RepID=A0A0V1J3P5_TRIPS|nr:hypothetical protein T4A_13437 [Trichinella pseudospiralis]KRZ29620.1 hypothetical protein T4B_11023 [Trichinella pseudospiralis]KRZ36795.1 hypothetical protein T4C_7955 [Trichinella pseudospiralis]